MIRHINRTAWCLTDTRAGPAPTPRPPATPRAPPPHLHRLAPRPIVGTAARDAPPSVRDRPPVHIGNGRDDQEEPWKTSAKPPKSSPKTWSP
ncbi:hypothetical protein GCM10009738_79630 [Kitasatospora viridis]